MHLGGTTVDTKVHVRRGMIPWHKCGQYLLVGSYYLILTPCTPTTHIHTNPEANVVGLILSLITHDPRPSASE